MSETVLDPLRSIQVAEDVKLDPPVLNLAWLFDELTCDLPQKAIIICQRSGTERTYFKRLGRTVGRYCRAGTRSGQPGDYGICNNITRPSNS
jgi:hypothetical protein